MIATATQKIAPVDLRFDINCSVEHAFKAYTEHMGSWWPLETHSVDGKKASSCHFEVKVGGRIYEVGDGGTEHLWGTVLECDAPNRLCYNWHPGGSPDKVTEVEVLFSDKAGNTELRIIHTGWEVHGERASELATGYTSGWQFVAGDCFVKFANAN
jgi:uncharacterized protein YndB with AHSA1/START domain